MKIDILTLFPNGFSYLDESIIKRAQEQDLIEINVHDLRDWSIDKHNRVDDKPFGGGAGMVIQIEPVYRALKDIKMKDEELNVRTVLTSASGAPWSQDKAQKYSEELDQLIIICGHYEGVDYRVVEHLVDEEISIGDYVLSGGELAAQIITDSITRLIPGVLGNPESLDDESHSSHMSKEYPHYTRPASFKTDEGDEWGVPDVLLSGDHAKINDWRKKQAS